MLNYKTCIQYKWKQHLHNQIVILYSSNFISHFRSYFDARKIVQWCWCFALLITRWCFDYWLQGLNTSAEQKRPRWFYPWRQRIWRGILCILWGNWGNHLVFLHPWPLFSVSFFRQERIGPKDLNNYVVEPILHQLINSFDLQ